MSLFLLYIVKVIACSGILYTYYWCFLRNKLFHHYNRFYLLFAMVLSLLLPFLQIPVGNEATGQPGMMYQAVQAMDILHEPVMESNESIVSTTTGNDSVHLFSSLFTMANALYLLYFAGLVVAILLFLQSLWYIRKLSKKYSAEWIGRIRFFMTAEPGTPFSFFRSVFWNDQIPVESRNGRQVFLHEYYHVQQKHSIDTVLAEGMLALAWFNPFFYLMKKELKAIHEFLADRYASENNNKYEYAQLLVEQAIASKKNQLTHSFFQPQIKRRITMIMRTNQLRYGYWSRMMALPVLGIVFFILVLRAQPSAAAAPAFSHHSIFNRLHQTVDDVQNTPQETNAKPSSPVIRNIQAAATADEEIVITPAKVRRLKRNTTTSKEVEQLFGKPLSRGTGDHSELWIYGAEFIRLHIEIHQKDHKVMSFMFQQDLQPRTQQLSYEDAQTIQQQKTTAAEIRRLFGEPNNIAITQLGEFWHYVQPGKLLDVEFLMSRDHQLIVSHHNYTEAPKMEVMERSLPVEINDDSVVKMIIKHYNKSLRYPALFTSLPPEGSIYFSVNVDGSNNLQNLQVYAERPNTNGSKINEIVVVGYAKNLDTTSMNNTSLSAAVIQELLKGAITKATQLPMKTVPEVKAPVTFYGKATFKLDRDGKISFEIKRKGKIYIYEVKRGGKSPKTNSKTEPCIKEKGKNA